MKIKTIIHRLAHTSFKCMMLETPYEANALGHCFYSRSLNIRLSQSSYKLIFCTDIVKTIPQKHKLHSHKHDYES